MFKTKKDSWFELIPSNIINDNLIKNDKKVSIIQIEETSAKSEKGITMMLCELQYEEV